MDSTLTYPKLRWPIDVRFHDGGDGKRALVLQCPLGISEKPLVLVPAVAPIVSLFDGALSRQEILARLAPHGLTDAVLTELITLLDQHLFLANSRFFAASQEAQESFAQSTVRPAALAGRSYPAEEGALRELVSGYLQPGAESVRTGGDLVCLTAPHIDYGRGGRCYGVTYPHLRETKADLFILMGTAHQFSEGLFHLCAKDFESPLGRLPCNIEAVSKLAQRYGLERSFKDQFLHKREHSLELQLPFMSAVKPGAAILPVLVGSFHRMVMEQKLPGEHDVYESFVGALHEVVAEHQRAGGQVCIIAGVDMAHVGKSFGDAEPLTPQRMAHIAERDAAYLDTLVRHDKTGLFRHICEDGDARRICGFPTMYTVLDLLERTGQRTSTELISYEQAVDYPGECAVTFAGLATRA